MIDQVKPHGDNCKCWICDVGAGFYHLGRATEDAPRLVAVAIAGALDLVREACEVEDGKTGPGQSSGRWD